MFVTYFSLSNSNSPTYFQKKKNEEDSGVDCFAVIIILTDNCH